MSALQAALARAARAARRRAPRTSTASRAGRVLDAGGQAALLAQLAERVAAARGSSR